jgi:hypothetical protein
MAANHGVKFRTTEEMVIAVAKVYGSYCPRDPVPSWWEAAEKDFAKIKAEPRLRLPPEEWDDDEPTYGMTLRTEAFGPDYGNED